MRYAIGIDLGGTNIAAGLVTEEYQILQKDSVPTGAGRPWQEIVSDMAKLAEELIARCGLSKKNCAGIGVGSPGTCNAETGEVVYTNNIKWEHVPVCSELTRLTGLPCRISNDANCAALGEVAAGAAKGYKNAVLLTLGTGVGSGIVLNGEIFEGKDSAGAELGHTTMVSGGVLCTCGRKGCVESYVSATALIRMARESAKPGSPLDQDDLTAKDVYEAKNAGDETASKVVAEYETYLGETAVNVTNLFRPDVILIGGGVSGQGDALTGPLNDYVRSHCYGGTRSYVTKVVTAGLGNSAGMTGAAALCLNQPPAGPLLLRPAFKDYIWGGSRLKTEFGKKTDMTPLAESWELSCHPDGPSVIENGPWSGRTLAEYLAAQPCRMGSGADSKTSFPLLVKLIDAAQILSVQVHPGDDYARRVEHSSGKTEMWYVIHAEENSGIYYGFKEKITAEELEEAVRTDTLTERLNWQKTKKGDVFFIPAGTVHAMGPGLLVAEIQQSSNLTYRLYDYGRPGPDGRLRPLHIQKALDVALREPPAYSSGPFQKAEIIPGGTVQPLIKCDRFNADLLTVQGVAEGTTGEDRFQSLLCIQGEGAVIWGRESLPIEKGRSLYLPAGMGDYRLAGHMELLRTCPGSSLFLNVHNDGDFSSGMS